MACTSDTRLNRGFLGLRKLTINHTIDRLKNLAINKVSFVTFSFKLTWQRTLYISTLIHQNISVANTQRERQTDRQADHIQMTQDRKQRAKTNVFCNVFQQITLEYCCWQSHICARKFSDLLTHYQLKYTRRQAFCRTIISETGGHFTPSTRLDNTNTH